VRAAHRQGRSLSRRSRPNPVRAHAVPARGQAGRRPTDAPRTEPVIRDGKAPLPSPHAYPAGSRRGNRPGSGLGCDLGAGQVGDSRNGPQARPCAGLGLGEAVRVFGPVPKDCRALIDVGRIRPRCPQRKTPPGITRGRPAARGREGARRGCRRSGPRVPRVPCAA